MFDTLDLDDFSFLLADSLKHTRKHAGLFTDTQCFSLGFSQTTWGQWETHLEVSCFRSVLANLPVAVLFRIGTRWFSSIKVIWMLFKTHKAGFHISFTVYSVQRLHHKRQSRNIFLQWGYSTDNLAHILTPGCYLNEELKSFLNCCISQLWMAFCSNTQSSLNGFVKQTNKK